MVLVIVGKIVKKKKSKRIVQDLYRSCCSELETLTIRCRPFYLQRKCASVILVAVYIPPQAGATLAAQQLAARITEVENAHPDPVVLILGHFNHVNMRRVIAQV